MSATQNGRTLTFLPSQAFRGDKAYGPPSDVYSFGMLLFEVVTRTTPWSHLTATEHLPKFSELNDALQKGTFLLPAPLCRHPEFRASICHASHEDLCFCFS